MSGKRDNNTSIIAKSYCKRLIFIRKSTKAEIKHVLINFCCSVVPRSLSNEDTTEQHLLYSRAAVKWA